MPEKFLSGRAPVYKGGTMLELRRGTKPSGNVLSCGGGLSVPLGKGCASLIDLPFVQHTLTSGFGRPSKSGSATGSQPENFRVSAAIYEKRKPKTKQLSDEERDELVRAYRSYYNINWVDLPKKASSISLFQSIKFPDDLKDRLPM